MERIEVRELRQHANRYLALVKAGETVEITGRGRVVARLVPPAPAASAQEQLIAEGRLIAATDPLILPTPVWTTMHSGPILDELRKES